jgi:hypothetical protein
LVHDGFYSLGWHLGEIVEDLREGEDVIVEVVELVPLDDSFGGEHLDHSPRSCRGPVGSKRSSIQFPTVSVIGSPAQNVIWSS